MPSTKRKASSPKIELRQQTLVPFLSSSPSQPAPKKTRANPTSSKTSSKPKRLKVRKRHVPSPDSSGEEASDVAKIQFEPEVIDLTDDEELASPRISRLKKRKAKLVDTDSDNNAVANEPKEEEIGVLVHWKGRRNGKIPRVRDSDSDEEPRKRKLVKGERPLTPESGDDIEDEVDEADIVETRFRARDKKTTFQKNLERLRRKKCGLALSDSSDSEEEGSNEDQQDDKPFTGARPDGGWSSSNEDIQQPEGDDSFIVEDDDSAPRVELPAEFSMNTYQDLTHHFKTICQLLVHLAVRPPEERLSVREQMLKDQWFSVPLAVTRRKLDGLRDSLVVSSVWRPDFKKPLEEYPDFELVSLDFAVPDCDACHLGGRMSTRLGRLSGKPYDRDIFEPQEPESASDSSEDEDQEPFSRKREFHLGRFCAKRTVAFHKFMHWEYSLYKALSEEIDVLRSNKNQHGFVRVSRAGGVRPPDDLNNADGIMAWLDDRKIIEMEWQKINDMMESARHLEMAAKRGEDTDR